MVAVSAEEIAALSGKIADIERKIAQLDERHAEMTLRQSGQLVRGTYSLDNGTIVGRVQGDRLVGYWVEDGSNRTCDRPIEGRTHWGRVVFTMAADGQSFTGTWGYCDDDPEVQSRGEWNGQRAAR